MAEEFAAAGFMAVATAKRGAANSRVCSLQAEVGKIASS